jgi:uncharacterized LabA/DUF88 family protein
MVKISQSVAILIDGNNIEISIHNTFGKNTMVNFDTFVPKLIGSRSLNRLIYFREGASISPKLAERLHNAFFGVVRPCYKSVDVPMTIQAIQLVDKVDTIIIVSGDGDFIDLTKYLKSRGVRIEVASVSQTTSDNLVKEADFHYEISPDDLFTFTEKKEKHKEEEKPEKEKNGNE